MKKTNVCIHNLSCRERGNARMFAQELSSSCKGFTVIRARPIKWRIPDIFTTLELMFCRNWSRNCLVWKKMQWSPRQWDLTSRSTQSWRKRTSNWKRKFKITSTELEKDSYSVKKKLFVFISSLGFELLVLFMQFREREENIFLLKEQLRGTAAKLERAEQKVIWFDQLKTQAEVSCDEMAWTQMVVPFILSLGKRLWERNVNAGRVFGSMISNIFLFRFCKESWRNMNLLISKEKSKLCKLQAPEWRCFTQEAFCEGGTKLPTKPPRSTRKQTTLWCCRHPDEMKQRISSLQVENATMKDTLGQRLAAWVMCFDFSSCWRAVLQNICASVMKTNLGDPTTLWIEQHHHETSERTKIYLSAVSQDILHVFWVVIVLFIAQDSQFGEQASGEREADSTAARQFSTGTILRAEQHRAHQKDATQDPTSG